MFTNQTKNGNGFGTNANLGGNVARACMACLVVGISMLPAKEAVAAGGAGVARENRVAAILNEVALANEGGSSGHGHCLSLPKQGVMFIGGLNQDQANSFLEGLEDDQLGVNEHSGDRSAAFQLHGSRWTSTAGDPVIPQGEPFFITYSFVLDGTNIPTSNNGDSAGPCNLQATVDANFPGGMDAFRQVVRQAFDRWQNITNIRYVEVPDDGAAYGSANGLLPSATNVGRGDVRISMRFIDGAGGSPDIAAVNNYPQFGGDMILDSANIATMADATDNFRVLQNILTHEHGHGLGLMHVMPVNQTKLMEPTISRSFDGPQEDDMLAATQLYGDVAESNDSIAGAMPFGSVADGDSDELLVSGMVIERGGEEDWYKFNATGGTRLDVELLPVGSTYEQGAQPTSANPNPGTSIVDASSVGNLRLEILKDGTVWRFADSGLAGDPETVTDFIVPGNGVCYIKVDAIGMGSVPQQYELVVRRAEEQTADITLVAQTATPAAIQHEEQFDFGSVEIDSDSHVFFTIANIGSANLELTSNPAVNLFGPNVADFTVNQQPASDSIAPGTGTSFNIGFRPSSAGTKTAFVVISNNTPGIEGSFGFTVTGSGSQSTSGAVTGSPAIRVFQITPDFEFGKVEVTEAGFSDFPATEVGESRAVFYAIENHGDADLEFTSDPGVTIVAGVSGFSVFSQPNTFAIPAGNPEGFAKTFRIQFSPQDTTTRTARTFIFTNASNTAGPFDFTLRGAGFIEIVNDCNANGIEDADEVADGSSEDCNENDVPDECDVDTDLDGIVDECDECPGENDLLDTDGDDVSDCLDNCPIVANADQSDSDADGLGDACQQNDPVEDCNGNGIEDQQEIEFGNSEDCNVNDVPDDCEIDSDGDDVIDACDSCPGEDDLLDSDGDSVVDCLDNCPADANVNQLDSNGDGLGNACQIQDEPVDEAGQPNPNDNDQNNDEEDDGQVDQDNPIDNTGDENEVVDEEDVDDGQGNEQGNDDDAKDNDVDDNPQDEDENNDQDDQDQRNDGAFCGAGVVGMVPVMLLGLSSMRSHGRRRETEEDALLAA